MNQSKQLGKQHPANFLLAASLTVFGVVCIASFFPDKRLWGLNHLAYYSIPTRLIAFALMAVFFLPAPSRWMFSRLTAMARILLEESQRGKVLRIIVLALAFILFLSLQSSTLLLGDGRYIANNMRLAAENDTLGVSNYFKTT